LKLVSGQHPPKGAQFHPGDGMQKQFFQNEGTPINLRRSGAEQIERRADPK
jgi:hypothetical protein